MVNCRGGHIFGDHRVQFLLALRDKPKEPDPAALNLGELSIAQSGQIANQLSKSEGRLRFRKRPSYLDGGKPNSVVDDHLSQSRLRGTAREPRSAVIDRRYSNRDATIPEDRSGPAVLPLFCLAPHGVFRASQITPRAVSSYLAFSPLPALFSKNRRCLFCDTFRHRSFSTAAPAYFTRHDAVWCSDFPPANPARRDSPAIICHRRAT